MLLVASSLLVSCSTLVLAQDSPGRFELGGSLTAVRTFEVPNVGVGLEGDLNFGRHFALDAAVDWLPSTAPFQGNIVVGLFGVKAGIRKQRLGYFVKVRPGFLSIDNALRSDFANLDTGALSSRFARFTETALDLGGVVEYYPARHWTLRWDAGDLLIFDQNEISFTTVLNGQTFASKFPGQTTNNFRFSTGVHYRF